MKVLVEFDNTYYLVDTRRNYEVDFDDLFDQINPDVYSDEVTPIETIKKDTIVITYFTDSSELA